MAVPRFATGRRPAKSRTGGLAVALAGPEGVLRDSVGGCLGVGGADAGPAGHVVEAIGVQGVVAFGVLYELEQGIHVPRPREGQLSALLRCRVTQRATDLLGDLFVRERMAAGVPAMHGRVQPSEVATGADGVGQVHGGEQLRVRGVGQQLRLGLPARVCGGDAEVEQGGAAAEMECALGRVGLGHGAVEVGVELDGAGPGKEAEPPRLGIVHGGGGCGVGDE